MATRTNYWSNPSLETGTTQWSAAGAGVGFTRDSGDAMYGSYSLHIVTDGSTQQGFSTTTSGGLNLAGSSGNYTASVGMWGTGTINGTCYIRAYYNEGGSTQLTLSTFAVPAGKSRVTLGTITPDPAKTINFFGIQILSTTAADYRVDGVLIELGDTAGEYFDGDSADAEWAGTAHASSSILTLPDVASSRIFPVVKIGQSQRIGPLKVG